MSATSIATELTRIQTAKADIKTAIEAKGVQVPSNALIDTYDTYIGQISGGGGGQAEQDLKDLIENDIVTLNIPSGTTKIKNRLLYECTTVTSVTIPSGVTSIGYMVFNGCTGLTSVTIPNTVTTIGYSFFYGCTNLKRVNSNVDGECIMPSGLTQINDQIFYQCTSLTSVTIPNGVQSIGESAFSQCTNLKRVNSNVDGEYIIPNNCTNIKQSAFYQCTSLTSVTIPNTVTTIGYGAFQYCTGLTSVTCLATTPPTLGTNAFTNTNNCPIYVPAESVAAYQAANNWSSYASRIQAIPSE